MAAALSPFSEITDEMYADLADHVRNARTQSSSVGEYEDDLTAEQIKEHAESHPDRMATWINIIVTLRQRIETRKNLEVLKDRQERLEIILQKLGELGPGAEIQMTEDEEETVERGWLPAGRMDMNGPFLNYSDKAHI